MWSPSKTLSTLFGPIHVSYKTVCVCLSEKKEKEEEKEEDEMVCRYGDLAEIKRERQIKNNYSLYLINTHLC